MSIFSCCKNSQNSYVYQAKIQNKKQGEFKIEEFPSTKKLPDNIEQSQGIIKIKKSDYLSLIGQHMKSNEKFIDMQFPPNSSSLGKIQDIDDNCQWKRISEIIQNPQLFDSVVQPSDVISGGLEKCYFLSAVASLAEDDQRIYRIFQNQKYNIHGIYKLKLRIYGVIKEVIVDDYVPVNSEGKPIFCQQKKNQFWVMIVEKAWAKIKGSYENIQSGTPEQVFKTIAYSPSKILGITEEQSNRETLWEELRDETEMKMPICVGTVSQPTQQQQQSNKGLVWGHFYSLIGAKLVKQKQSNQWHKILKLRNPWGKVEWEGICSQSDVDFWNKIEQNDKQKLCQGMRKEDDGIFLINWKDFCKYFNTANICYYQKNPCYEIQTIYPDRKHGDMFALGIKKQGQYIIQLHQTINKCDNKNKIDKIGIEYKYPNRATIFLMNAKDFKFIDGSFTTDDYDSTFKVDLQPGKYLIYAKVDPIIQQVSNNNRQQWIYPRKISISCYSKYWISTFKPVDKNKISLGQRFYQKMFADHARSNKKKTFDNQRLWIAYKQLPTRTGFAYICFGVQLTATNKFIVSFKEKDFNDINYTLKKPYKGKGQIELQILPGQQVFVVARISQGVEVSQLNFPPPMNVKIKGIE